MPYKSYAVENWLSRTLSRSFVNPLRNRAFILLTKISLPIFASLPLLQLLCYIKRLVARRLRVLLINNV